jgi:2-succinyl-5-enolpyruvyl-6-hydroxy-3-cyclohexene-1-carboxylate synthase
MNGLLAAKKNQIPATIIVVNNNGGGIFSFLPQFEYPEYFEAYFGTPHELQFKSAAELYGINYYKVENWKEFRFAVKSSLRSSGTEIIEIGCDRTENVGLHKKVWQSIKHRQSKS